MSPQKLHSELLWCEVDGRLAPDCRRVLRDERQRLGLALERGDAVSIRAIAIEVTEVARMWGIKL